MCVTDTFAAMRETGGGAGRRCCPTDYLPHFVESRARASAVTPAQEPSQESAFTNQLSMIKNENGEQKYDNVPKA